MHLFESSVNARTVVLVVDGLHFQYPQRELFAGLSASIPGGVTLVRGGDGVGKTTLLQLLAGVLPAQAGRLRLLGVNLGDAPEAYRQHVFWVEPRTTAYDQITALQYFDLQRQRYPGFMGVGAPRLGAILQGLSLAEHLEKPLYMLSTGSKRKVWLAAAFAAGATLTLLDEPLAALDKPSIAFVVQQLAVRASDPAQAFVVAHWDALDDVPLAQVIELGD
jgi:ABC-type multidrug transport system ATPase subunit